MKEIHRGAEAILYRDDNSLIKFRPEKEFRLKEIDDRLRSFRTRREAKILTTLAKHDMNVPLLSHIDEARARLHMEFIDGVKLRDVIEDNPTEWGLRFGKMVGRMHSLDVVHGDLTTSNLLVRNNDLVLIDFGLSQVTKRIEDKAVDLRVLERALESRHCGCMEECFAAVLKGYSEANPASEEVITRFGKVQSRGRNKK